MLQESLNNFFILPEENIPKVLSCEDSDKRVYDTNTEEKIHGGVSVNLYGWGLIFSGVCDAYGIIKLF